ncbi:MAG: hypothetical protein OEV00_15595 [Acidobacteriota bacterium]|nr:hypothetical protein [Acidobacteriota bacterium]MDH3786735.1 hypothetical protein [Acidobacteriota bacterium]
MRVLAFLLVSLIVICGCNVSHHEAAATPPEQAAERDAPVVVAQLPSGVSTMGSATGVGRTVEFGWGIAVWDDEDRGKLIVGLLESKPSDEDIASIVEKKSLFMSLFRLAEPMLEFTIHFDSSDGTPDISKPTSRSALFVNFDDRGPMTLSRTVNTAGREVHLDGSLNAGIIHGRLVGTDTFEIGDDRREYEWDVNIELPVR